MYIKVFYDGQVHGEVPERENALLLAVKLVCLMMQGVEGSVSHGDGCQAVNSEGFGC